MTRKELGRSLLTLSAGTIADIIGSDKYIIIDRAINTATLYAYEHAPDTEIESINDFSGVCSFVRDHWKEKITM